MSFATPRVRTLVDPEPRRVSGLAQGRDGRLPILRLMQDTQLEPFCTMKLTCDPT
jgi:hypothetical protein